MSIAEKSSRSIGKKIVMAATGVLLLGFVLGHLAGNLLIFAGADAMNAYAKKLQSLGPVLWGMRFFLIVILLLHILTSIKLTLENRTARPVSYKHPLQTEKTSYAAKTMMFSGVIVAAFILYHLAHFTFKWTHPEVSHMTDALGRHDVYSMVILSFQSLPVALAYIIAMILLCSHLSHGIASICQSAGLNTEKSIPLTKRIGRGLAILIFLGYSSIPFSALTGFLTASGAY